MKKTAILFRRIRAILLFMISAASISLLVLFACGNRFYIVRSGSMEPEISTGDLIIVNKNYEYERLSVGDIITYTAANGALVTHRAVAISPEGIETKGDANTISDGIAAEKENYLGREWLAIPKLGFAAAAALNRRGRILLITAIVSLTILSLFPVNGGKQMKGEIRN